jgi:hypothetical protein
MRAFTIGFSRLDPQECCYLLRIEFVATNTKLARGVLYFFRQFFGSVFSGGVPLALEDS